MRAQGAIGTGKGPAQRLATLTAVLALAASGFSPAPSEDVPEYTLVDPASEGPVLLRADGPLLHVVFFATWCPPCREELPRLTELDARWRDAGYRLVLIAVPRRQSADKLRSFLAAHRPPGRLLFDREGAATRGMAADQIPAHVLIGPGGEIVLRASSLDDAVERAIEQTLRRAGRAGG